MSNTQFRNSRYFPHSIARNARVAAADSAVMAARTPTAATRRHFLCAAATLAAGYGLVPQARAAAAGITQLEGSLALIDDAGCNVLALVTQDGLVLVDSGTAEQGAALLAHVDALSPDGVHTLFNTHWHADQCGNNLAIAERGASIVAHMRTRLQLGTRLYLPREERYREPLPEAALPEQTFYTSASLQLDGNQIDYGYLPSAHTNGDIYVYFREQNVLAVGDVASPQRDPALDWYGGGWLGGRVDAMDQLLALCDDATRIVPSYGPVMSKAALQAERDMMWFLYDKTVELVRMGMTPENMLAEGFMDQLPRKFDDPYRFLYDVSKGLWGHHNKLAPNIV